MSLSSGFECTLMVANLRFEFQKRTQYPICAHNETLSIVAMRVRNPDGSRLRIYG